MGDIYKFCKDLDVKTNQKGQVEGHNTLHLPQRAIGTRGAIKFQQE